MRLYELLLELQRADLLTRAGRTDEALTALDRAIELAPTEHERDQLVRRRREPS